MRLFAKIPTAIAAAYRASKGQQVVRVERVNVEAGAQAVVGNVTHGGRGDAET